MVKNDQYVELTKQKNMRLCHCYDSYGFNSRSTCVRSGRWQTRSLYHKSWHICHENSLKDSEVALSLANGT